MLALSDGMGSGEYARRISDCTISLVEAMPNAASYAGLGFKT